MSDNELSDLDDINSDDLNDINSDELDDFDDIDDIDAQLRELETSEDFDDLDFNDEELGEYTEEELLQLEKEVAELEDENNDYNEENNISKEETGNLFIGALQRPKYAFLMENLEEELEKEALANKQRIRNVIPKYLVNPFALQNRIDYEEIFDEIDPEEPDLKIWIIDNFEPIPIPLNQIGKFYSGDCYVILYITEAFEGGIVINIHHWIGEQASCDKYGSAAFRAVELNTYLGGRCHIYRELEGRESQLFLDYFDNDIEYLVGGTAESFHHVKPNTPKEIKPCLYQLIPQSTGQIIMKLVELSYKELSSNFIYILDTGKRIFQWNGFFSECKHRHKALAHPYTIRANERSGQSEVIILTEGQDNELLKYEEDIFWKYLKGHKESPKIGDKPPSQTIKKRFMFEEEDEEEFDEQVLAVSVVGSWDNFYQPIPMIKNEYGYDLEIPLKAGTYQYQYKVATSSGIQTYCDMVRDTTNSSLGTVNIVNAIIDNDQYYTLWGTSSDSNGKLSLNEIDYNGRLERDLLDTKHSYILDCNTEIFVWVGQQCQLLEKQVALAIAKKIYTKYERPDYAQIFGVYESVELTTFTSKFIIWDFLNPFNKKKNLKKQKKNPNPVRFTLSALVNVDSLLRAPEEIDDPMIDNGEGTLEIRLFTLKDGASQSSIPLYASGIFFMESCYIILYKYDYNYQGRIIKKFIVYFWEGLKCKNSNTIYSKYVLEFLKMLLDRVGPYRLQSIRIKQGKEPKHFMRLFNGRIILKQGAQDLYSKRLSPNALYEVCITSHLVGYPRMHIIQVDKDVSSFNAVHCFILFTKDKGYIWVGKYSFPEEIDITKDICKILCNSKYQYNIDNNFIIIEQKTVKNSKLNNNEDYNNDYNSFIKYINGNLDNVFILKSTTRRLYCLTYENTFFEIYEIQDYAQIDLLLHSNSILLLHTRNNIFIWKGNEATDSLFNKSIIVGKHWINEIIELYDLENPQELTLEYQGKESELFSHFFNGWQNNYIKDFNTIGYNQIKTNKYYSIEELNNNIRKYYYEKIQDNLELLELICSSNTYSKVEEQHINPNFNKITINFDKELIKLGLKQEPKPEPIDKLAIFKENIKPGEVFFHWKTPALAVALKGSWNNWEQIPMVSFGKQGFAVKVSLDPGRYYYKFIVATNNGADNCILDDCLSTNISLNNENEHVNILRVYLCTHPTFLEKQRKLQEEKENEKRKAEEEANKEYTAEELLERQRKWKAEQRKANEERLRRQLEEKRKNRLTTTYTPIIENTTSTIIKKLDNKKDLPKPKYDSIRSKRNNNKSSILDMSTKRSPKTDTSVTYSKSLLSNLSSSPKRSTRSSYSPNKDISPSFTSTSKEDAKSYRERRRLELGLGSKNSSTSSTSKKYSSNLLKDSPPSRTSSLIDKLDEKLDVPSKRDYSSSISTSTTRRTSTDLTSTRRTSTDYTSSRRTSTDLTSKYTSPSSESSKTSRTSTKYSPSSDYTSTRNTSRTSNYSPKYTSPISDSTTSRRTSTDYTSTRSTSSRRTSTDYTSKYTSPSSSDSTRSSKRTSTDYTSTRSTSKSTEKSTSANTTSESKSAERERKRRERRKALGLE